MLDVLKIFSAICPYPGVAGYGRILNSGPNPGGWDHPCDDYLIGIIPVISTDRRIIWFYPNINRECRLGLSLWTKNG
jgi:hypothetical protein